MRGIQLVLLAVTVLGDDVDPEAWEWRGQTNSRPTEADWGNPNQVHPLVHSWHQTRDWFDTPWRDVSHLLPEDVGTVLHVGCGNSSWAEDMAAANIKAVNTDKSAWLIKRLRRAHPSLQFDVVDAAALPYHNDTFGAVVDKAMLDAIDEAPGNLSEKAVLEMYRVLRPGGVLFVVSLGPPLPYVEMLNTMPWASHEVLTMQVSTHVYVWRKHAAVHDADMHKSVAAAVSERAGNLEL